MIFDIPCWRWPASGYESLKSLQLPVGDRFRLGSFPTSWSGLGLGLLPGWKSSLSEVGANSVVRATVEKNEHSINTAICGIH